MVTPPIFQKIVFGSPPKYQFLKSKIPLKTMFSGYLSIIYVDPPKYVFTKFGGKSSLYI